MRATLSGSLGLPGRQGTAVVKASTVRSLATLVLAVALTGQTWARTISTVEINAGLDPDSPRIQAFVGYLRTAGMTIEYVASDRSWHAGRHGEVKMSIRTLPGWATEDEMKNALQQINLAYMLSPRAHIAMSYPSYSARSASASNTASGVVKLFKSYDERQR